MQAHPSTGVQENHAGNNSVTIASAAIAVPEHVLTREGVKYYYQKVFSLEERRLNALMTVIDNSRVENRHCVFPVEYFVEPRPLDQISREYQEHAVILGRRAAEKALADAGLTPRDVDMIITVSCTGFMIPSVDAHLINDMGFRSNVRRLPITELGCAAGAVGVTRAYEYIRAFPGATVLLLAIELATLTFQRGDVSQANLISCALFGDGAAALVITGKADTPGPRVLASASHFFPNSLDAMGFELKGSGFHIVLSKDVPEMIRGVIKGLITEFLGSHALTPADMAAFVLHPGGNKLLRYVEEELEIPEGKSQYSWDVLRDYGNLSSATVLFVMREWLTKRKMNPGDYGLMAAFGPGFSAEMLLLQWA
jgi:alkylresorcinol/alkylpyrone synthase